VNWRRRALAVAFARPALHRGESTVGKSRRFMLDAVSCRPRRRLGHRLAGLGIYANPLPHTEKAQMAAILSQSAAIYPLGV